MHRTLLLLIIVAVCALVGCKNIEDLGPGNTLALENQDNLKGNVVRLLNNFEKLLQAQPNFKEKDQKIFDEQKAVIIEQLVINYGWLLVIKEAVEANDIDPAFFGSILDRAPAWINEGKKINDLIQEMLKKKG